MPKLLRLLVLMTAGLFLFHSAWASTADDEDMGFWLLTDLEHKTDHWTFRAGEDMRFRENMGIYYYDTHIGAGRSLTKYLTLGAEYLQVRQTRTSGRKDVWYWEERPRIYATLSEKFHDFKFENRHMLEFRFKESAEDTVRYRPQLAVTAPWKVTRFELQPYTSGELFLETTRNGLTEIRLIAGLKFRLWKNLSGSLYYMREPMKNSQAKWKDLNILGTSLKISC